MNRNKKLRNDVFQLIKALTTESWHSAIYVTHRLDGSGRKVRAEVYLNNRLDDPGYDIGVFQPGAEGKLLLAHLNADKATRNYIVASIARVIGAEIHKDNNKRRIHG